MSINENFWGVTIVSLAVTLLTTSAHAKEEAAMDVPAQVAQPSTAQSDDAEAANSMAAQKKGDAEAGASENGVAQGSAKSDQTKAKSTSSVSCQEQIKLDQEIRFQAIYPYLLNAPWAMFGILLAFFGLAGTFGGYFLHNFLYRELREKLVAELRAKMQSDLDVEDNMSSYSDLVSLAHQFWRLADKLPKTIRTPHIEMAEALYERALTHAQNLPSSFAGKKLYVLNAQQSLAYLFAEGGRDEKRTDALQWSRDAFDRRESYPPHKHSFTETFVFVRIQYCAPGKAGAEELVGERAAAIQVLQALLNDPALSQEKARRWRRKYSDVLTD